LIEQVLINLISVPATMEVNNVAEQLHFLPYSKSKLELESNLSKILPVN